MTETFTFETGEIDTHDGVWLVGDFLIECETDDEGLTFKVIDVISMRRQIVGPIREAIVSWVDDDTAPRQLRAKHKSLVRQAYIDWSRDNDPADIIAATRADDIHDARLSERV